MPTINNSDLLPEAVNNTDCLGGISAVKSHTRTVVKTFRMRFFCVSDQRAAAALFTACC